MTKKERIRALLEGKRPNFTPYHCNLTAKIKQKLARYFDIPEKNIERYVGNHIHYISFHEPLHPKKKDDTAGGAGREWSTYNVTLHKTDSNTFIDEFGITWDNAATFDAGDWGMVDHPVKNMDYHAYSFPDGRAPGRFNGIEKNIEENADRFIVLSMVGLFDTAWHVTGLEDLLMGMALGDKRFISTMLDKALEFNVGVIEQVPAHVDGIRFMEDWGQQKGLIMGLDNWRKFLKPRLREMYAAVKRKGCAVMSHSCGDITELFPELIEIGVDISDPLQPEVMDLEYVNSEYGKDIVFFGGLGCQSTLPHGTPEDVVAEAKNRIELFETNGNYILGSAGSIPTDAPVENVVALYSFCKSMIGEAL